ncbi:endonuclease [Marinobacterium nitratireducens]|uniref:Endonuclease n=1 Tax=Marinobacterium nitratireducens TaxID=518897 RepID=A0A918DUK2_9GAMM|nr:DNA/RNA non-specific endonuclease [Marinobacterium nitratireducens]GGO83831.1 endonuclease [Marinobacterium nitratireducens]
MNRTTIAILILLPTAVSADILSVHCPLGCPSNPVGNDLLFAHIYVLSNNPATKFADWVAYEVDVVNFGASPGREWRPDPLLDDDETLEPEDYSGAFSSALRANRGHQAPLAAFAGSRYWPELNYLSNITPQDKDLNQGPWADLEDAVRAAVSYRHSLFGITGTLYESAMPGLIGANEFAIVPSGYFKIIYDGSGKAAGFVMNQDSGLQDDHCSKNATLTTIQSKVSFVLPALSDSQAMYARLGCD